jgi:hypothetical protein
LEDKLAALRALAVPPVTLGSELANVATGLHRESGFHRGERRQDCVSDFRAIAFVICAQPAGADQRVGDSSGHDQGHNDRASATSSAENRLPCSSEVVAMAAGSG